MDSTNDILQVKGIGEKTARIFHKIGIYTITDLLHTYPRDYVSYPKPQKIHETPEGEFFAVHLKMVSELKWKRVRNLMIGSGTATDGIENITVTFFNTPYLKTKLVPGSTHLFYGRWKSQNRKKHMEQPQIFKEEEYEKMQHCLQPVYVLTKGLTNRMFQKAVKGALSKYASREYLPAEIIAECRLLTHEEALQKIHFPVDFEDMMQGRRRLVFEEFFEFMFLVRMMKDRTEEHSEYKMVETAGPIRLQERLPYHLTAAQHRVYGEIVEDVTSGNCMNRLIQGDVGSGKTILAFLALLLCVENGFQGAMMAPTEILATQHYEQLCQLTRDYELPFCPVLLTGSMSAAAKREAYRKLENGEANVVLGTHALIQERVVFQNLALVVTDEQHRFGVRQRESLHQKGRKPHVLVMSATPIPRTLAIILYGDLHVSLVDERPANRLPVKNCVVGTSYRPKAYAFMEQEIKRGRQVYIICPMVEENEDLEGVESVISYTRMLREKLDKSIQIEMLHGKMEPKKKQNIMEQFAKGNIHVLVATTVIEVGINVPNATVMMIENAERFGLAQLHQLRGRIGRGQEQSYCIFMSHSGEPEKLERLKVLNESNDGFYIAEQDLKLRGPGELFGIRQSGELAFQIADIYQDAELLKKASQSLDRLLAEDAALSLEEHSALKQYMYEKATKSVDFGSI